MSPPKRIRLGVKEDIRERNIPSKRPKLSQSMLVASEEGSQTDRRSSAKRKTKGTNVAPVKFEDMIHLTPAGTVLKHRHTISPKDLPLECLHGFRVVFRPAIRDLCGTLKPWESPSETDIIRIWDSCFPKYKLEGAKVLHTILSKLVRDTVKHWRQGIARTAVESLNMVLKSFSDNRQERIERAAWLLGDDEKDRMRPFYYKKYEDDEPPTGIFQSSLVAATLATHLESISCLPQESRMPDYPIGALASSILAVKRALTWAKTGVNFIPKTSEGYFSRSNWGDQYRHGHP